MMETFECNFKLRLVNCTVIAESLHEVIEGFWIDSNLKLCNFSANYYWIPPSQIDYVKLIKGDPDGS